MVGPGFPEGGSSPTETPPPGGLPRRFVTESGVPTGNITWAQTLARETHGLNDEAMAQDIRQQAIAARENIYADAMGRPDLFPSGPLGKVDNFHKALKGYHDARQSSPGMPDTINVALAVHKFLNDNGDTRYIPEVEKRKISFLFAGAALAKQNLLPPSNAGDIVINMQDVANDNPLSHSSLNNPPKDDEIEPITKTAHRTAVELAMKAWLEKEAAEVTKTMQRSTNPAAAERLVALLTTDINLPGLFINPLVRDDLNEGNLGKLRVIIASPEFKRLAEERQLELDATTVTASAMEERSTRKLNPHEAATAEIKAFLQSVLPPDFDLLEKGDLTIILTNASYYDISPELKDSLAKALKEYENLKKTELPEDQRRKIVLDFAGAELVARRQEKTREAVAA